MRGRFWPGLASLLLLAVLSPAAARGDLPVVALRELPAEAQQVLQLIRRDGPFPHERDGVTFGNYEGLLPVRPRGHYREYTVTTPGVAHRGARRIVVGCAQQAPAAVTGRLQLPGCRGGGEFYYTADHYRSFRRIVE